MRAVIITEIKVCDIKTGRLSITYSTKDIGSTADNPSKDAHNSCLSFIPGTISDRIIKTVMNKIKQSNRGA